MSMLNYISENNRIIIDFLEEQEGHNISVVEVHSIQENSATSLTASVSYLDSTNNYGCIRDNFHISVYDLVAFVYKNVI